MERKWLVYCHTHKVTGKKYFGITSKSAKQRWGKNGYGYQSSPFFYSAIQKYGWNNFYHIILHKDISESDAKSYEKLYIALYKTNTKKYGYNCTAGGDGTVGTPFSDEARRKRGTDKPVVQMNMDGKYINTYFNLHEAARQTNCNYSHISSCCNCRYKRESHKGYLWMFEIDYNNWDKTLETYYERFEKEKVSHPKKIKSKNKKCHSNPTAKPVSLYSDSGELLNSFNSIYDASIMLQEPYDSVRNSCLTKEKTKNGHNFRFLNDDFERIKPKSNIPRKRSGISVVQYTINGEFVKLFAKIKDVETDGFSKGSVGKCCLGKRALHKNYIWQRYKGSKDNLSELTVKKILSILEDEKANNKAFRKVTQYDINGKYICTYNSASDAEKMLNIKGVSNCCNGSVKTVSGYIWCYTDYVNDKVDLSQEQLAKHKQHNHKSVNQYDLDGNLISTYSTIRDAYEACGKPRASCGISAVLTNKQATAYGYKWAYAD